MQNQRRIPNVCLSDFVLLGGDLIEFERQFGEGSVFLSYNFQFDLFLCIFY